MKHIYTFLTLFLFLLNGTLAQKPIELKEDSLKFTNGSMPGFTVMIPEVEYDAILKSWSKELQSGTRSKVVEKGDELSIFGAKIKDVSDNPVNVYSKLTDSDNGVTMHVAIELERDKFIGNAERSDAKDFLFEFAKKEYQAVAQDQLNAEEKKLRDLEGELAVLKREKSRMEKSISNDKGLIAEENSKLENLNNQLANADTSVAGMGNSDPDLKKEMEKERKKAGRDIKSSEKKVSQAEKDVSENQRKLPENAKEQEAARIRIEEQEAVVGKFADKLEAIKNFRP